MLMTQGTHDQSKPMPQTAAYEAGFGAGATKRGLSFKTELSTPFNRPEFASWRQQLKFPRVATALTTFTEVALKNNLKPFSVGREDVVLDK